MKDSFIKKKIGLLALLVTLHFSAISQHGNPLQFLSEVSQSAQVNPSYQNNTEKLVVGLPIISGIWLNGNANFSAGRLELNNSLSSFYNAQNQPGEVFFSAQLPLLFLSLKRKTGTFSFSISEKLIGVMNFDEEVINFFAQGLQPYYGKNESIGKISFTAHHYREIAAGYSSKLANGICVGIRPKILFGKLFYDVDIKNFNISTPSGSETLKISPEGNYTISGPIKIVLDEEMNTQAIKPDITKGDLFFKLRNMGAGVDLGISYSPNKRSKLALSVLDLGFTKLKYKTYDARFTNSLHYNKYSLYQSSNNSPASDYRTPSEAIEAFADSLPHITTPNNLHKGIMEMLPFQINATLEYKLPNNLQIGASNHFSRYKKQSANFLTGFVRTQLNQKYELVGTLSLYNVKRILPGLGASYTGNSAQYFISTNNILHLMQATSAKNLNLYFGINFLFATN